MPAATSLTEATGKVGTAGAAVIAAVPVGREMDIWLEAGAAETREKVPRAAMAAMTLVENILIVGFGMRMVWKGLYRRDGETVDVMVLSDERCFEL